MLLDFFEPQMFTMTVYTKLILFAAIMDLGLAMIVWLGTKRYSARIFVLIPLIQTVWNINHALMHSKTASAEIQHFLLNNSHFLGVILVSIAAYFALTFPEDKKPSKKILFSIVAYHAIIIPFYYFSSDFMITGFESIANVPWWEWKHGAGGILFRVPFFIFWAIAVYTLYTKSRNYPNPTKRHLLYMFWGIFIASLIPSIVCVVLPNMGIYQYTWMGSGLNFIWVSVVTYSIIKHNQMNVRIVLTELLVLAAILILFLNLFL